MEQTSDLPVACNLSALDAEQNRRHDALVSELFNNFQSTRELANGYEFSLPGEDKWYLKLAEWVTLERQCCSFLTFEQGFNVDGKIWLRLTGDENAKQFLRTYLGQGSRQ
jgi:hypothetical protein